MQSCRTLLCSINTIFLMKEGTCASRIIMPVSFCLFGLVLRKEEKKASLLQSYNLIIASGNSIRQKPISFLLL